jgi:Domain of unknown function (DUF3846)
MVTGVIIPANETLAVSQHEFNDLRDYQKVVGGLIEAIDLDPPAMTFFANDEAKLIGLPINRRATILWWLHSPATYGFDVLSGDAVLVGQPDQNGDTQSAPAEFISLLMDTPSFKVDVQTSGPDTPWYSNDMRFEDYFTAALCAVDLTHRWAQVTRARVVAA